MTPWEELARARAPGGGVLTLSRRDGEYVIWVDNAVLMTSHGHASEQRLAVLACEPLAGAQAPRVLVGGLGMGFTLRAALDVLPADAEVVVAEIAPSVIEWNRGVLAHLAGEPLTDARVTALDTDVGMLMRTTSARFDAIVLDVDNGPQGMTRAANHALYSDTGLVTARRALRPGGCLAVWSVGHYPAFERRMERAGFRCEVHRARAAAPARGARHVIYIGRVDTRSALWSQAGDRRGRGRRG